MAIDTKKISVFAETPQTRDSGLGTKQQEMALASERKLELDPTILTHIECATI